jgi:hypothetical protein
VNSRITFTQLEVLDTAGAEQFNSLNEVYIKVRLVLLAVEFFLHLISLVGVLYLYSGIGVTVRVVYVVSE